MHKGFYRGTIFVIATLALTFAEGITEGGTSGEETRNIPYLVENENNKTLNETSNNSHSRQASVNEESEDSPSPSSSDNGGSENPSKTTERSPSQTSDENGQSENPSKTTDSSPSQTSDENGQSENPSKTTESSPSQTSDENGQSEKPSKTTESSPSQTSDENGKSENPSKTTESSSSQTSDENRKSEKPSKTTESSPSQTSDENGQSEKPSKTTELPPSQTSGENGPSRDPSMTTELSLSPGLDENGSSEERKETTNVFPTSHSSNTNGTYSTESQKEPTLNSNVKTQLPNLDGKVISISSEVHLKVDTFPRELCNKSSETYKKYWTVFHNALSKKFKNLRGFIGIVITGFRNGSIIIDYSIKCDAVVIVSETNEELNKSLSNINQNWTEFKRDLRNGNITETLNENKTKEGMKHFLNNGLKNFTNKCNVPGVCGFGFSCVKESCQQICNDDFCNRHGKCVLDYKKEKATCACDAFHTGETCKDKNSEVFPSKERLLIIEIAGGAGGGVIMFLFIVLVCVCVQWRKSAGKEKMSDEKKTLKENETFDLRDLGGKSNPIYDKDVENDVAESIPSRRDSFERKLPIFIPSDEKMGHRMESFGKPLEYDRRNSERNFIRREDGRIYHVIDDGGPSNQTLIYQPSRYQHSNGSVVETHAQSQYTDFPRRQNVYDSIDTTREYKINRPNIGRRSQNYEY